MDDTSSILRILKTFRPYFPSKREGRLDVYSRRALIVGGISFFILAGTAFWHINIFPVSDFMRHIGFFSGVVAYITGLFSIIAPIILPVYRFIKSIFKNEDVLILLDDTPDEYEHEKNKQKN